MLPVIRLRLVRRWTVLRRTPFGCLLRIFAGRILRGGGESDAEDLGLGPGVILVLLAMPGILLSLLMLEEYGSLIRFMRGAGAFDPYTATVPDEYLFIALSMAVSGAAALWGWDSLFPDRRDYANLVVLPIPLRTIFVANVMALLALVTVSTVVVNAASAILFPVAVVGSQPSVEIFFIFTAGHFAAVLVASVFAFVLVFALAGVLMAVFPASLFRRISLLARFLIAICLFTLVATSFAIRPLLEQSSALSRHRIEFLPPVWFVGISQRVWGNGGDPFYSSMTHRAVVALALSLFVAIVAYGLAFRTSFMRIPETADAGPFPLASPGGWPRWISLGNLLPSAAEKACYDFALRTLSRSDVHLLVVLAFLGIGLVAASASLGLSGNPVSLVSGTVAPAEFLAVPFILAYCVIAGARVAFEIPVDTRANWIFRFWLDAGQLQTRAIARCVLHGVTLPWLVPVVFAVTSAYFGVGAALLHSALVVLTNVAIVEVFVVTYRKMPFTSPVPVFESHSGVILLVYLLGFWAVTSYLPELEHWTLLHPLGLLSFLPVFGLPVAATYWYRKQMLEMDKQLIFEEPPSLGF